MLDLGLDEYLEGDGVTVVEWADRAPGLLGEEYMSIEFHHVDDKTRRIESVRPRGSLWRKRSPPLERPRAA